MCNLYSITTNEAAISALFRVVNRYVGNLAPMPGVFPDYKAPIVRTGADGRELETARWGMPSSSKALMDATKKRAEKLQAKGKTVDFKELLRIEPDGGTTKYPQHQQRPLEAVARTGQSLPCAAHIVFRVRHDRRQEGAGVVCPRRMPSPCRLRRHLDELDQRTKGEGRRSDR